MDKSPQETAKFKTSFFIKNIFDFPFTYGILINTRTVSFFFFTPPWINKEKLHPLEPNTRKLYEKVGGSFSQVEGD